MDPQLLNTARGLVKSYGERLRGCNVRNISSVRSFRKWVYRQNEPNATTAPAAPAIVNRQTIDLLDTDGALRS
jgi:hypothetical protein